MSSSGKGQSVARDAATAEAAWDYAQTAGRAGAGRVIVEGFVDFDYEITLLTVRHAGGTSFCAPIGHRQEKGDYRESWQPHPMVRICPVAGLMVALSRPALARTQAPSIKSSFRTTITSLRDVRRGGVPGFVTVKRPRGRFGRRVAADGVGGFLGQHVALLLAVCGA